MFASVGVPAGVAVSVPEATSALAGAVDALLVVEASDVADDELRAAMVDLRRLQSQLAAVVTELTAEFDARRAWADDGSRNGADWLAFHAHRPRPEMASEVQVGRRLRTMPCVRDAWRAGDVSFAHARVLARLAGHPRAGAHFPEAEAGLVDDARRLRFDDFERVTRYWLAAADPDGPERDRRRDHDLRRFSLAIGLDGVGHSDGRFTPLGAATVGGMLERIEDELFQTDLADARERLGDAATVADLRRTPAQRRHDAVVEMALRAGTAPADGKRPAPLVTIVVGYEAFAGPVCELARGTVVAPGTVAELLGQDDALLQRAVFDGPDRLTELSAARTFRGTLRRLLEVRQRRCDHPTCHVPADRCQGDHAIPWSAGGETSQANGRLQCGPHNRWSFEQMRTGRTIPDADGAARPDSPVRRPTSGRGARAPDPGPPPTSLSTEGLDTADGGGPGAPPTRTHRRQPRRRAHDLVLRHAGSGGDSVPLEVLLDGRAAGAPGVLGGADVDAEWPADR